MTTYTVDFSTLTNVVRDGVEYDQLILNGVSRWQRVWTPSSQQVQVNQGYWTYPAAYQEFVETGKSLGSQFQWNPWYSQNGRAQWIGSPSGSYYWVSIGDPSGNPYWVGQNYTPIGYTHWVYPSPYYTDNWVTVTQDTSHYVYYY